MNNSNSTQINSGDLASCPLGVFIFFTTIIALICLTAFIGNILVIATVYKTPSLRTSTNYYYVNMAVSDYLASFTTWPLYLTDDIVASGGSVLQGSLATVGCKGGMCVRTASSILSILSLVLIAVDRFIATVFPLKAALVTPKLRVALLLATWLISTAFSFPVVFFCDVKQIGQNTSCKFSWNGVLPTIYLITIFFLFFLAPLTAIVILYSRIMRALGNRIKSESETKGGNGQQKRHKQSQNFMKIFKSTVTAFFVRYLLLTIFLTVYSSFPDFFLKDNCNFLEGFGYFVFPLLGAAINPFILFTFSSNFRHALRDLGTRLEKFWLCCKLQSKNQYQVNDS